MRQTLFSIPNEFFGLPVFGFGLLLAVWAVTSAAVLTWRIRRQGFNADTLGYAEVLAVFGAVIFWVLPLLCDADGLPIRGYGMMMLLAVLSGMGLAVYRARRVGVDPEMIFTLAFWMIVPGIVGARVVYVCEYWDKFAHAESLGASIFAIVNVAAGGLVVYGAFFGGMIGLGLFWWRYRVPLLATADLVAPSLLLGLALGRVGCLLNGCCFGGPCNLPWKVTFPWNSPVHQHEAEQGITDVYGIYFRDGRKGTVIEQIDPDSQQKKREDEPLMFPKGTVIEQVNSDSLAAGQGLRVGMKIDKINDVEVESAGQAAGIVLGIDKLNLKLSGRKEPWIVDDPPESQIQGTGPVLKFSGLEFCEKMTASGRNAVVVSPVRPNSREASAGIQENQQVESVSGRKVGTIQEFRDRLAEHRRHPWLDILPKGYAEPIKLPLDRPLPRTQPVHPTQVYSTIDALILCFLLLCYDRFRRRDGVLTALLITIYPITRFLIECIRKDEKPIWPTPFTISQNISLVLLTVAVCLWIYILRRSAKLAFWGGNQFYPADRPEQQ